MVTSSRILSQLVTGLFVSVLLIALNQMGVLESPRKILELVMKPEIRVVSTGVRAIHTVWDELGFIGSGVQELQELRSSRAKLQQEIEELSALRSENEALKTALGVPNPARIVLRKTPARVLSSGQVLVIEQVDVEEGQPVVSPEGALVGVVSRIGRTTAEVSLLTHSTSRISVTVELADHKAADGELHGSFGGSATLVHVLTEVDLQKGLSIVTRGTDDAIPPTLLIGWVGEQQEKDQSAVYQSAGVTLAANIKDLTTVFVLQPAAR